MARKRRMSPALAVARQRLAGLNKITPAPNLGPNTTVAAYQAVADDTAALEESHNQLAAQMDDSSNRFDAQENLMADWYRRALSAVEHNTARTAASTKWSAGRGRANARSRVRRAAAVVSRRFSQLRTLHPYY